MMKPCETGLTTLVRQLFELLLGLIYPRVCAVCGVRLLQRELGACTACMASMRLYRVGIMQAHERLYASPLIGRLYSVFVYRRGNQVQRLILAYKYRGHREVARLIVEMLLARYTFEGYDLIVAVPLSRARLAERGYNQAMLIARHLARHLGIPATDRLIRRRESSAVQARLGKMDRLANAQSAFYLSRRAECVLRGKRVLLVDDILTTGATLTSMATLLERCGVSYIDVVTGAVATRQL